MHKNALFSAKEIKRKIMRHYLHISLHNRRFGVSLSMTCTNPVKKS